jgi:predicted small secreted protein
MRASRAPWPALATAAALIIACNAITGLGEDYALAPGGGDAEPTDDAPSAEDGATGDGGIGLVEAGDGGGPDGGGPITFSCDAGAGGEVLFCTDFESPVTWDGDEQSGGTWAVTVDAGRDASRALHAHANDAIGVSRKANVWKSLALTDADDYRHYEVFFEFRVANKSLSYAALGILAFTQPVVGLPYYGLAVHPGAPYPKLDVVSNGAMQPDNDAGRDQPLESWHRCFMTFDKQASGTYDLALFVDDQLVDARSDFDVLDPQSAELRIGILFGDTNPGTMDVYIDNVVVRGRTN